MTASVAQRTARGAAVVTGGGGGLGRAIAMRLSADGFAVGVLDIDEPAAKRTWPLVTDAGGQAVVRVVDLRDVVAVETAVRGVDDELGPLTALVNNAAIFPTGPFLDTSPDDYDDVVDVNQRAYFFAAQAAARLMAGRDGGAIVNMSSITQHGGWSNLASYVVTKGAAAALTRALGHRARRARHPGQLRRARCVPDESGGHPSRPGGVQPPHHRIAGPQAPRHVRRAGRRGVVPRRAGLVLRHRADAQRGWRLDHAVTPRWSSSSGRPASPSMDEGQCAYDARRRG